MANWNAAEREQECLDEQLESGAMAQKEYNRQVRELQRDVAGAYEDDQQAALDQVDAEWGC